MQEVPGVYTVTAYATADEYELEELMVYLEHEGLYEAKDLPSG